MFRARMAAAKHAPLIRLDQIVWRGAHAAMTAPNIAVKVTIWTVNQTCAAQACQTCDVPKASSSVSATRQGSLVGQSPARYARCSSQ